MVLSQKMELVMVVLMIIILHMMNLLMEQCRSKSLIMMALLQIFPFICTSIMEHITLARPSDYKMTIPAFMVEDIGEILLPVSLILVASQADGMSPQMILITLLKIMGLILDIKFRCITLWVMVQLLLQLML